MALVYLSPSAQECNSYAGGGNEALYMNRIADEMEPWFRACGISFQRNTTDMTPADCIEASNRGQYALHLALHSNTAPKDQPGSRQGVEVFYSSRSRDGQVAAELIAGNLRDLYPRPDAVRVLPTDGIGEVVKVSIPSAFIKFAYHDNPTDAEWIRGNQVTLAQAVSRAVAEYFGLPCLAPQPVERGTADLPWDSLNIRTGPSQVFPVIAQIQDGTALNIYNRYRNWFVVETGGIAGYALQNYITIRTP